jgi:hypothetical protein
MVISCPLWAQGDLELSEDPAEPQVRDDSVHLSSRTWSPAHMDLPQAQGEWHKQALSCWGHSNCLPLVCTAWGSASHAMDLAFQSSATNSTGKPEGQEVN